MLLFLCHSLHLVLMVPLALELNCGFFLCFESLAQLPRCQLCCGFLSLSVFHFLDAFSFFLFKLWSSKTSVFISAFYISETWDVNNEHVTTFIIVSSAYFFSACFFSALDLDCEESLSWYFSRACCLISFFFSLSSANTLNYLSLIILRLQSDISDTLKSSVKVETLCQFKCTVG